MSALETLFTNAIADEKKLPHTLVSDITAGEVQASAFLSNLQAEMSQNSALLLNSVEMEAAQAVNGLISENCT